MKGHPIYVAGGHHNCEMPAMKVHWEMSLHAWLDLMLGMSPSDGRA